MKRAAWIIFGGVVVLLAGATVAEWREQRKLAGLFTRDYNGMPA